MALAIESLCFCPPETFAPPCSITESYLFSIRSTKSLLCATLTAVLTSSAVGLNSPLSP